jgi:molybdopterin-binding protein
VKAVKPSKTWFTPREFAERVGISYPTVKQWLYHDKLQAVRTPGGHYRISAEQVEKYLRPTGAKSRHARASRFEISGRNQIAGRIEEIRVDGLLAQVKLSVGDQRITAIITAEAVRDLNLRVGQRAAALIKSTEVMIVKS